MQKVNLTENQKILLQLIEFMENQLKQLTSVDTINSISTTLIKMNREEIFKKKEEFVKSVHKNKISKDLPIKQNGKTYLCSQTKLNGERPRFRKYEDLINYLFDYYTNKTTNKTTFTTVYKNALDFKVRTEDIKSSTVLDYNYIYKAFITDELGNMNIRDITQSYLEEYLQNICKNMHPTKKRFTQLKTLLNMVFSYAQRPENNLVEKNVVPHSNKVYAKNFEPTPSLPEDKAFQPEEIELIREHLFKRIKKMRYDVNSYAIIFSSYVGPREGEIPSLKWSDINFEQNYIHIHSQQNMKIVDGKKVYYYNPTTKNEKGISNHGRFEPLIEEVKELLLELKNKQNDLSIKSEWVFCKADGNWINTDSYAKALYRLCKGDKERGTKGLDLKLSNNHAFRIALNSYVFVPMGLPVTERAKLLGHSVETNLKHYTFSRKDNLEHLASIKAMWDIANKENVTSSYLINNTKKKAQNT